MHGTTFFRVTQANYLQVTLHHVDRIILFPMDPILWAGVE